MNYYKLYLLLYYFGFNKISLQTFLASSHQIATNN